MKFLSRKLIVVVVTGLLNVLVMTGTINSQAAENILKLIDMLAGCYVLVQGIIDGITVSKNG